MTTGHPFNTPVQDTKSTCPTRDRLLCKLLDEMERCSMEQLFGCDRCPMYDKCLEWLWKRVDVCKGFFTEEKLAKCQAEFAVIRAGKNGHNGNGQK